MHDIKACEACHKDMVRPRGIYSDKQWRLKMFCSMKCHAPHHARVMKGKKAWNLGIDMVEKPGYGAIHARIKKKLKKPSACSKCKRDMLLDLCNISGKYLLDLADWEYLCRRCHMLSDGRIDRLKQMAFKKK